MVELNHIKKLLYFIFMALAVVSVFMINKLKILDNVSFYNNALDRLIVFLKFYNFYILYEISKERYRLINLFIFLTVIGLSYSVSSIYYQRVVDFRVGVDLSTFTLFITTLVALLVTKRNISNEYYEAEALEEGESGEYL